MGVFRTVFGYIACRRCAADFRADVQFKTGDDYGMELYEEGVVIDDVAPDAYDGTLDSFCRPCSLARRVLENDSFFSFLRDAVAAARIRMFRAQWRFNPEAQMIEVTRTHPAAINIEEIAKAASLPQTDPFNLNYNRFFFEHEVYDRELRLNPRPDDQLASFWRDESEAFVDSRLVTAGWSPLYADFLDIDVVVSDDRRIRLDRSSVRPGI